MLHCDERLAGALLREWRASAAEGQLGRSSSVVGDVDGDGWPDIAGVRYPQTGGWELLVQSARAEEPALRVELGWEKHCAKSFCDAGDFDGDGRDDLAVGGALSGLLRGERRGLRVLSGRDGSVLLEVSDEVIGVEDPDGWSADFGSGVARLSDLDEDGVSDFLVAAEGYQLGGGAFVLVSSKTSELLALETAPSEVGGCVHFASGLDAGEDWDADGTPDWLVTSSSLAGGPGIGAVCIYSGATRELLERVTRDTIRD